MSRKETVLWIVLWVVVGGILVYIASMVLPALGMEYPWNYLGAVLVIAVLILYVARGRRAIGT